MAKTSNEKNPGLDSNIARGRCAKILFSQINDPDFIPPKKDRLVISKLKIVGHEARRYSGEYDDIFQAGSENVLKRLKKFRPPDGDLDVFVSYSARSGMAEETARNFRPFSIPAHVFYVLHDLKKIYDRKTQEFNRDPRPEELVSDLAEALSKRPGSHINKLTVNSENIQRWLNLFNLSLFLEQKNGKEIKDADWQNSFERVEETIDREQILSEFKELLMDGLLDTKQKMIVRLLHGLDNGGKEMDKTEAGKILGMHRTTVEYHYSKAMTQLARNEKVQNLMIRLKELEN